MTRSEILEKANACVTGERPEDYGSPEDLSTIGDELIYWTDKKGIKY